MTIKNKVLNVFATGILATGMIMAKGQGAGPHRMAGSQMGAHRLDRMATQLSLTDAQKETAKGIFQQARDSAKPLVDQLKQGHQAMQAAIKAGKSDAELTQLATQQGSVMGQLAAIHAKAFSQFYAQLTPDQKTKADQLHQTMRQHSARTQGQQQGQQ